MNPTATNKEQFKEYLASIGAAASTINGYQSFLNNIVTEAIRNLCNVDLGSIFGVMDARLLTHWFNVLKADEGFNILNQETHNNPVAALKKYIEYIKHLSKQ